MKRQYRGMSLPELLLALAVFSVFIGVMFHLFQQGYQAFGFLSARQSLQGQALRLKMVLSDDLTKTNFRSFGTLERTTVVDGETVSRDDACCLTLSDWTQDDNFSEVGGIPKWDRYLVYQTTLNPEGKFDRLLVTPSDPLPLRIRPLGSFDGELDGVIQRTALAENIHSFEVRADRLLQRIDVRVVLLKIGGKRGLDESATRESFEAAFRFTPRNTTGRL